jgi:hypothetical protein
VYTASGFAEPKDAVTHPIHTPSSIVAVVVADRDARRPLTRARASASASGRPPVCRRVIGDWDLANCWSRELEYVPAR